MSADGPAAGDDTPPTMSRRTLLAGGLAAAGVASVVVGLTRGGGADGAATGGDEAAPAAATDPVAGRFRPTNVVVFGHSWAAGTNVRREQAWPSRVADGLGVRRPVLFPARAAQRTDFGWGGARATGPASEHGAGWVLRSLPTPPRTAPSLILLLTGDLDIERHGQGAASRRLMGGGIHAALGRLMAREVHEETETAAWSFGPGWRRDTGRQVNSGRGVAYATAAGARFTVRLPEDYDGSAVTVGLPLYDRTVGGTIAWDLDGEPLDRRTDLSAMQATLTADHPSAVWAERFAGFPRGAHALTGTWTPGPERGSAVVVDYWSVERRGPRIVCALMPDRNPWDNAFGGITTASNRANREALAGVPNVHYVDLEPAVRPTGTAADRRFWDSDESSHLTLAGERAVAQRVLAAVRRLPG
jgi:hypothetical protein